MPVVQMPDGSFVEMPDSAAPGKPTLARSLFDDAARGLGKTVAGTPELLLNLGRLSWAKAAGKERPELDWSWRDAVERDIPTPKDDSRARELLRGAVEGAGGSLVFGGGVPGLVSGAGGGVGAEIGTSVTPNSLVGPIIGGLLGGGLAGLVAPGKPNFSNNRLGDAAKSITPEQWNAAQGNIQKMDRAGARTGTLAEAIPGDHQLIPLAQQARAASGDNALARRLSGREGDLQALTQRFLDSIGPQTSAEGTTFRAGKAADAAISSVEKARSFEYGRAMSHSKGLEPRQVRVLYEYLRAQAAKAQSQVDKDALEAVADSLMQANKVPVPQPPKQELGTVGKAGFRVQTITPQPDSQVATPKTETSAYAKDVKQLQRDMQVADSATGGKKLDAGAVSRAYRAAQDFVKMLDPAYRRAEEGFKTNSERFVEPATRGPLGQLSGKSYDAANPVPASSRLSTLVDDQSPADIASNLRYLAKTGGDDLPGKIARTLVERKLKKGGTDPGSTLRGAPGSLEEARLVELLKAGGPKATLEPLEVADLLQRLKSPVQGAPQPSGSVGGAIARPFTSAARFFNEWGEENLQRSIAELLANPTMANLTKLQTLSMRDPLLRARLAQMGGIVGISQGMQEQ